MPNPPSFRKVNPADSPILFLSLSSESLPLSTVDEYAQTMLAQHISTIEGVGSDRKTVSTREARSATESARTAPRSTKGWTAASRVSNTTSELPASISRPAIGRPMLPRPMKPKVPPKRPSRILLRAGTLHRLGNAGPGPATTVNVYAPPLHEVTSYGPAEQGGLTVLGTRPVGGDGNGTAEGCPPD